MEPVTWTLVAVVAAVVVIVVTGAYGGIDRTGMRQFVADVRAGVRREPDAGHVGVLAGARRQMWEDDDEDGSLADLFAFEPADRDYVRPVELAEPIARLGRTARTGVGHLARRVRR